MGALVPVKCVLIVDDDPEVRGALRELLESWNLAALDLGDGRAALDWLVGEQGRAPGLIILDMEMPELPGWEFLKIIRCYHRLASIPVIVLSARDHSQTIREHSIAGYLLKPHDPDTLLRTVTSVLAQSAPRNGPTMSSLGSAVRSGEP